MPPTPNLYGQSTYGQGNYGGLPIPLSPTATCEVAFATDPSATPVWTDISAWLLGFSIQRGRQAELNRVEAGTANIVLDNLDRRFDPSNAASPYAPNVVPMRRIRLSAAYGGTTYRLFSGYVENWPPTYPGPVDSNVEISAVDAFKVFNLSVVSGTYPAEATGARLGRVLDAIGWPAADRALGVGDSTIQGATLTLMPALEHIQQCMDAENGLFFMTGNGIVKFVDRGDRISPPYTISQGTFGDGVGELLFVDIALDYSDVQLWNDVRYTRVGGVTQVATDTLSQTRYYTRTLVKDGLLMLTDAEALSAAQWARDRFRNPALRIERIVLDGEADPDNLWPQVFGRELGDRVTVHKTPPGGGARIDQVGLIEHIDHAFSAAGGVWLTGWQLSPADKQLYWILEHAVQGILESTSVLSY
jgi:hypothetical protein